jgi:PHD-finger
MKLHQAKLFVFQAKSQLDIISSQSRQRKVIEAKENELSLVLRRWVLHVRDKVLVPTNMAQAEKARPPFGESLSQPMKDVLHDADRLGIADFPDILSMENHFKCMSWSLTALAYIRRKPTIHEVNYVLASSEKLRLPDEKVVRTLRYMANRASQCQIRIRKALSPKPGEKKPINVSLLQDILQMAEDLPLYIPETKFLQAAIDDKGCRHCICGGPNDGLEMLQCDACKKWFHSACVGGIACLTDETWLCQFCGGPSPNTSSNSHMSDDSSTFTPIEPLSVDNANSLRLPDPKRLWPPFGLRCSKESVEALGLECTAIPEVSDLKFLTNFPSEKREAEQQVGK